MLSYRGIQLKNAVKNNRKVCFVTHLGQHGSNFVSLFSRDNVEFCGWHPVWGQVSVCDARGHSEPHDLYLHDNPLPGARHHLHVSHTSVIKQHHKQVEMTPEETIGSVNRQHCASQSEISFLLSSNLQQNTIFHTHLHTLFFQNCLYVTFPTEVARSLITSDTVSHVFETWVQSPLVSAVLCLTQWTCTKL